MKKLVLFIAVIVAVSFASCKKQTPATEPVTTENSDSIAAAQAQTDSIAKADSIAAAATATTTTPAETPAAEK